MKILKSILNWLVFSNVYIAVLATAMYCDIAWQLQVPVSNNMTGIIFHGTLLVYSIHWFFNWNKKGKTERLRWNATHKWVIGSMALIGAVGLARFIVADLSILPLLLPPAGLIFVYELRMLNKHAIRFKLYGKTLILTFTWIYATALMPIFQQHISRNLNTITTIGIQTCVVYLAALLFDRRDAASEKQFHLFYNNIKYFKPTVYLINFLALFFLILSLFMEESTTFIWGKWIVLVMMNATMRYTKEPTSDYWYYLLIDGLMGLPIGLVLKAFLCGLI